MARKDSTSIPRLVVAVVGIALIVAAFLRGDYLLGLGCGIAYVFVTAALIWLFARSFNRQGKVPIAVVIFSVPVGFAMAFPAVINSDVQFGIDDQATDRTARAELKHVFESDAAFAELSISTRHRKVVHVTIYGALPTHIDLERLRNRISTECPMMEHCLLRWDVELRDSNQRTVGLDRKLFPSSEEAE